MRDQGARTTSSKDAVAGVRVQRTLAKALAAVVALGGVAFAAGSVACNSFTPGACPPSDPPATAKYLDYDTIGVDIGTSADTGDISYGMAHDFTGGSLSFQESGKELHMRITADPKAKQITAIVPTTCTDALSGSFKLVVTVPPIHAAGDGLTVTVE